MILSVSNLSKFFGVNEILKDINFGINNGEKVAIVGVNGAGKTTLFKILTKEENYDSGIISYSKGIGSIGFLSQMLDLDEEKTIYETFIEVFKDLIDLEKEIRTLEKEMAIKKNYELEKIMILYSNLNHEFEEKKGYEYKSRIRGVIKGLGFSDDEEAMKLYKLSGGQKSRVSLGKLLLSNPDLLLLDEPTNHLDIESIEWLEEYLNSYENSILLISHDRYFINKIANKIIEIENKKLSVYNGNYNFFVKQKEINREVQLRHYLNQQKEIERQKKIIRKFRSFATENAIIKAKSKEKLLEKIELVDKPETLPDVMRFSIQPFKESGNNILDIENLSKKFDNITLFENINFGSCTTRVERRENPSKVNNINSKPNNNIMHNFRFRETYCFAAKSFNPRSQSEIFSLYGLCILFADYMIIIRDQSFITTPIISIKNTDFKRCKKGLKLRKNLIFTFAKSICNYFTIRVIKGEP